MNRTSLKLGNYFSFNMNVFIKYARRHLRLLDERIRCNSMNMNTTSAFLNWTLTGKELHTFIDRRQTEGERTYLSGK